MAVAGGGGAGGGRGLRFSKRLPEGLLQPYYPSQLVTQDNDQSLRLQSPLLKCSSATGSPLLIQLARSYNCVIISSKVCFAADRIQRTSNFKLKKLEKLLKTNKSFTTMTHLDCGDSFSHSNFRHKDFSNHWTNTVTLHLGGVTDKSFIHKAFKHPCT